MFTHRRTYSFLALVFLALFCAATANAQGVGKISAKVTDAKTGEILVRAAVQIVETKQGAFTKDNGVATIINVPPSQTYTVTAKYANYKTQTLKNVKVQSDITTSLTIALSTTEQKPIIVESKRLVEITNTKQGKSFESAEITNVPGRNTLNDIVQLTPGVSKDNANGGYVINGSRGTSNSVKMNGMEITDPVNGGTNALQVGVSKFAVSELNITTSGADASNGNASGGFISSTTKAGGANFELNFHYRQEIPALFGSSGNGYKQMAQNDRIYELAIGGPITEDLKYYVTARGNTREFNNINEFSVTNSGLNVTDPYGNNAGQLPHTQYYNRALTAKLTFNLFGFNASLDAQYAAINSQINNVFLFYGDRTQLPASNNIDQIYSLNGRGQVGTDGVLEFTAGYGKTDIYFGKYDQSAGGGLFKLYKIYDPKDEWTLDGETGTLTNKPDGIIDIYTPVSKQIPDPRNPANPLNLSGAGINPFTGHIEGGAQSFTTNNAYGLLNQFYSVGNPSGYSYDNYTNIQGVVKYTQQVSEHLLNVGVETHIYTLNSFGNGLPWDANPFKDSFYVKPFSGAAYIVDKMEFSEITFNPSLRFDIYNPGNDRYLTDPFHPYKDTPNDTGGVTRTYAFAKAPVQTQLSPRLGITYAISEQTTFNFNYNLYFKQPLFNEVLRSTGGDFGRVLLRGNQIIGNGALKGERTTEIVVGFTTALTDILAMTVQGVYKDMRNQTGLQRISSDNLSTGYTLYSDDQYGNSKSVQLSLEKRMRDNYSVRLNYTISTAKGTSSSSTENYGRLINTSSSEDVSVLPLQPFNLSYDRPHVAQLIFALGWNKGEGPKIFGERLLELFNLSFTTEFQSGLPYTKLDLKFQQAGEFNADRNPAYFQTNASLSRSIRLSDLFGESMGNSALDLQLEVLNLFNRTEPITVYPTTGQGDNDGQPGTYTANVVFKNDPTNADGNQLDGVGHLKYNSRWDLNKDNQVDLNEQQQAYSQLRKDGFARRTNYQIPRRVFLNVSFRF